MPLIITRGEIPDNHARTLMHVRNMAERETVIVDVKTAYDHYHIDEMVDLMLQDVTLVREKGLILDELAQDLHDRLHKSNQGYIWDPRFKDFEYRPFTVEADRAQLALARSVAERTDETLPPDVLTIVFGRTAKVTESRWPVDMPGTRPEQRVGESTRRLGEISRRSYDIPILPEQQARLDAIEPVDDQLLAAAQFEDSEREFARVELERAQVYNELG